ncbi:hypothetical protein GLE_3083 [Lysobacter enzymogenes]|uniref:Uncharacterized protein n=2 Tax=Lysobacter enzymogenes TaxID=69 RepID=A0A0S2DIT2_LYSEN|nr:hypothetical protein GLE_3083 [Lysobacter enzymogenes]
MPFARIAAIWHKSIGPEVPPTRARNGPAGADCRHRSEP